MTDEVYISIEAGATVQIKDTVSSITGACGWGPASTAYALYPLRPCEYARRRRIWRTMRRRGLAEAYASNIPTQLEALIGRPSYAESILERFFDASPA